MQKSKRKKRQKNKVDFNLKNITPSKHERIGNLNLYSEEIVKELIDKLISLTMTKIFREKVDKKISDFCFEGVIRVLNLAVSISSIEHDIDNIYDVENISDDIKRLNTDENSYKKINHYKCNKARNKIAEKDMFEYTNINRDFEAEMNLKNKDIDDYLNKSVFLDSVINRKKNIKSNFWGKISHPKSFGLQRFAPKSNILNRESNLKGKNKTQKNKEDSNMNTPKKNKYSKLRSLYSKKFTFSSYRESNSKTQRNNSSDVIVKKERKYYILEMGKMQRLEEDKSKMEETEEIKELRKLKLEKIKFLKDEEDRLNEAKKLIVQSNSKMEYNIDTINLTSQERAKNIQVQRRIIEDQIKKGNFTYDFNHNIILVRQVKPDSLEEEFPEAITKQKEKENIISNENKENQVQLITNNNNNEKPRRKSLVEEKNKININYFTNKYGWKIDPSGSNFKLINPEVGVTVYQSGEIKTGGNQFFEKYKRFSLKDYSKMLKEITDQQEPINTILKKGKKEENKKEDINDIKLNTSSEISKIKKGLNPFNQKIKNIKLNILKTQKKMNKSQSEIFAYDKISLYKNIFVNEEKEINKKNESGFFYRINPNDLFLKRMKNMINKNKNKSFQIMDSFNKSIIRNTNKISKVDKDFTSLPIIPVKKNKSQIFSKKDQYFRTRIKKMNEY